MIKERNNLPFTGKKAGDSAKVYAVKVVDDDGLINNNVRIVISNLPKPFNCQPKPLNCQPKPDNNYRKPLNLLRKPFNYQPKPLSNLFMVKRFLHCIDKFSRKTLTICSN
jgi:hypothetical protein